MCTVEVSGKFMGKGKGGWEIREVKTQLEQTHHFS